MRKAVSHPPRPRAKPFAALLGKVTADWEMHFRASRTCPERQCTRSMGFRHLVLMSFDYSHSWLLTKERRTGTRCVVSGVASLLTEARCVYHVHAMDMTLRAHDHHSDHLPTRSRPLIRSASPESCRRVRFQTGACRQHTSMSNRHEHEAAGSPAVSCGHQLARLCQHAAATRSCVTATCHSQVPLFFSHGATSPSPSETASAPVIKQSAGQPKPT